MRIKRVAMVSVITFLLGGVCGGAYAYVSYQNGQQELSLTDGLEQMQDDRAVAQFVSEQEKLRPNGLEESKIETGSKYVGITYNVKPATVNPSPEKEATTVPEQTSVEQEKPAKSGGFLNNFLHGKEEAAQENLLDGQQNVQTGIIATHEGSLRVRAAGNMEGKVIGQVNKGDTVQIVRQEGSWYQIITSDGLQGYVSAQFVEVKAD